MVQQIDESEVLLLRLFVVKRLNFADEFLGEANASEDLQLLQQGRHHHFYFNQSHRVVRRLVILAEEQLIFEFPPLDRLIGQVINLVLIED